MKELIDLKQRKKPKNPVFIRQDTHKKKRLSKIWRKPRGSDSKLRLRMQNRSIVSPGYGTPKKLRGHARDGEKIVYIKSAEELSKISENEIVIISGKIGARKRIGIIEQCLKMKIKIQNILNPEDYVKSRLESFKKKKEQKSIKETKKEEVKEKKDKESIEDKLSEEDKKKLEKKEIDRLLTKKF